ncbi:MAG: ATP-binding cassette domain-containing protein [Pseudomonadota bacterium]|nr:ATP-binding cassette domain-containing protein [Pseudomonadota bacterium]
MIKVEGLNIFHHLNGKKTQLVKNLQFELAESSSLAIVGESGSGKTLSILSLMGLLPPNIKVDAKKLAFFDQNILSLTPQDWCHLRGSDISMVFQEPLSALNPLQSVEKQLREAIVTHRPDADWFQESIHLLEQVELKNPKALMKALPHELSGGQRQRIVIAMAIANKPKLLIADEPTTALDVMVQMQILRLLKKLQINLGMSLILVTHDLPIVRYLCDEVLVMRMGKVEGFDKTKQLFLKPPTLYTKALLQPYSCRPNPSQATKKHCLEVKNLEVNFTKGHFWQKISQNIIKDINFNVMDGESLGIIGESGSGKTTLAMALCRLMAASGQVIFNDYDWLQLKKKVLNILRPNIQMVFQDPFSSLPPRMNVGAIIGEGIERQHKKDSKLWIEAVEQALRDVKLSPKDRFKYPNEFSGGQRQRIAIARAIIMKPRLLILDEPTSALDQSIRDQILNLLAKLQIEKKLSYILITHDLRVIEALCHRVIVMNQGKIVEKNTVPELLKKPKHTYTKKLIEAHLALVEGDILL